MLYCVDVMLVDCSCRQMVFQPLNDSVSARIEEQGGYMASQGLRVIGLAVRPLSADQANLIKDSNNFNLSEVSKLSNPRNSIFIATPLRPQFYSYCNTDRTIFCWNDWTY